jgi:hypothetical protein
MILVASGKADTVGTASALIVCYGDFMRIGSVICDLWMQRSIRWGN